MVKVGDKIRIIGLCEEPYEEEYIGNVGVVQSIGKDCYGEIVAYGTWGGIAIYLNLDKYEIID